MTVPDKWIIIKITKIGEEESIYKVFASFYGGYLGGDSWKINSGIVKSDEHEHFYYFYGQSGSCYKCHKKTYGTSSFSYSVITHMIEEFKKDALIEIMDEDTDWESLIKNNGEV